MKEASKNPPRVSEVLQLAATTQHVNEDQIGSFVDLPPMVVGMILRGAAKLPIGKIERFARFLDLDPVYLLRITLQEYVPDVYTAVLSILNDPMLSETEWYLIQKYRQGAAGRDRKAELKLDAETVVMTVDLTDPECDKQD